jgi:catechol 2,3-dioxygenase-like lactoylglutathione lyase family enzyme
MTCKFVKRKLSVLALILAGFTMAGCVAVHTTETHSSPSEHKTTQNADRIRLEHVAINVENPVAMAKWYCENLGMKIVRQGPPPVNMRFISDAGGNMMLELYNNPPDAVPDYASMDPLMLHIAFMVDDVKGTCRKLIAAGATIASEIVVTDSGDELAMLRDPWGVSIQFLKRAKPMLSH